MLPRRTLATALALGAIAVPAHAAPLEIVMENLVIAPAHATAKVGDTVEMDQQDIFAHTATAVSTNPTAMKSRLTAPLSEARMWTSCVRLGP